MKPHDLAAASELNLEHYWMPFTDNRRFRAKPRLVAAAKDMYYTTVEGRGEDDFGAHAQAPSV
jgi:adenosylmethionine-8-amino-7-oxononanoate aminotransferase